MDELVTSERAVRGSPYNKRWLMVGRMVVAGRIVLVVGGMYERWGGAGRVGLAAGGAGG